MRGQSCRELPRFFFFGLESQIFLMKTAEGRRGSETIYSQREAGGARRQWGSHNAKAHIGFRVCSVTDVFWRSRRISLVLYYPSCCLLEFVTSSAIMCLLGGLLSKYTRFKSGLFVGTRIRVVLKQNPETRCGV